MNKNLSTFASACKKLLDDYNDFWVLAGVTDCSFEEGTRSDDFVKPCDSYADAGVTSPLLDQLRAGVNGNLATILSEHCVAGSVVRNKWRGQDLHFQSSPEAAVAFAEVKLVFDCTLPKFYDLVAHDWDKLRAVQAGGFQGDLFLAVFFLQLPRHEYPGGRWYGSAKESPRRSRYLMFPGIATQYAEVRRRLPDAPAWPGEPPYVRPLSSALTMVDAGVFNRRYASILEPDAPWQFDPAEHLIEAAAGVAVWQINGEGK